MYRYFLALATVSALAACSSDGNPLLAEDSNGVGTGNQPLIAEEEATDETTDVTSPQNEFYASAFGDASLRVNAVTYDPATDQLAINNLPFDGDDNLYARNETLTANVGSPFGIYQNVASSGGLRTDYYAVFRRTPSGYSQVSAVGTDSYIDFGYGGAAAQRLNETTNLPETPENYAFTGEYAAVRTIIDDANPPTETYVQYVSGIVNVSVDIEDFDPDESGITGGTVGAVIFNREFFDANGVQINMDRGGLTTTQGPDFISLQDSTINFDNWTINQGTATVVSNDDTYTNGATGNWQGLFTGPNGEEIAGIVVVEGNGPIGIDPTTGEYVEVQVREAGGFIATR